MASDLQSKQIKKERRLGSVPSVCRKRTRRWWRQDQDPGFYPPVLRNSSRGRVYKPNRFWSARLAPLKLNSSVYHLRLGAGSVGERVEGKPTHDQETKLSHLQNWPFCRSPCVHTPPCHTTTCFSTCLRRLVHWASVRLGLPGFFKEPRGQEGGGVGNNINNIMHLHVILCYCFSCDDCSGGLSKTWR